MKKLSKPETNFMLRKSRKEQTMLVSYAQKANTAFAASVSFVPILPHMQT